MQYRLHIYGCSMYYNDTLLTYFTKECILQVKMKYAFIEEYHITGEMCYATEKKYILIFFERANIPNNSAAYSSL